MKALRKMWSVGRVGAFLIAPLLTSTAVQAVDIYAGIGAGVSNSDASGLRLDKQLRDRGYESRTEIDDRDKIYRGVVGLQVTKYLGVEAEFIDLGDVTSDVFLDQGEPDAFSFDLNRLHPTSAQVYALSGVVRLPIDDGGFLMLKAGYLRWDGDVDTRAVTGGFAEDKSVNGDGYILGAALWATNDIFGARLGYDWVHLNGDGIRDDQRIGVFSASLIWWITNAERNAPWPGVEK